MYDLHKLGWDGFQRLCLTVTREILGQTVASFLNSHDGGKDGAFAGTWTGNGSEDLSGQFVIQCKFTSKSGYNLTESDLSDEFEKAKNLVDKGVCDSYVLMTNAGLSGVLETKICQRLKSVGVKHVRVLGSDWINQQILESKRLRTLVPRVYGLGDLSQILDERAYDQSQAVLEFMREDLSRVVVTEAYHQAVDALQEHGFVLLIGEPAAGKTTLASLLAMVALDQWNALVLKLDEPRDIIDHWNPSERSQFIWVDDAFGVTQYEDSLVREWNRILTNVRTMLSKGSKIVLTSRDYIYNRARYDLKEQAFPLLSESQVVIDVRDLTVSEKRRILYNHVKLGNQPTRFRRKIKPHLEGVANHPRFIPEIARRLADPNFTRGLKLTRRDLAEFVEKRDPLLQQVLKELDRHSRAALALIYMRNGQLESPIALQTSESDALNRLGSDVGQSRIALEGLEGSFVLHSHANDRSFWQFRHPTIGDSYSALLAESHDLIDIFVQGSEPDRILRQVTCGEVGLENTVVVPSSLFPQMLLKLGELRSRIAEKSATHPDIWAEVLLQTFLSRRCSSGFLRAYVDCYPSELDKFGDLKAFLTSMELDLAARLLEFCLLPEKHRVILVEKASKELLEGDGCGPLNSNSISSLFTEEELDELYFRVKEELIPDLENVSDNWKSRYEDGEDPDELFQPLFELFDSLRDQFGDAQEIADLIEQEEDDIRGFISKNNPVREPDPDDWDFLNFDDADVPDKPERERSIFDDIDDE